MKSKPLLEVALHALNDLKGLDIVTLDVSELTSITDHMIVCTGRSNRHVKSLAENVIKDAKKHKASFIRQEGQAEGEWVIVDLGDVVVHIMQAATRELYNLEDLWEVHADTISRHRK